MDNNQIGLNAGIVWRTLNASHCKMSINELGAITLLTDIEISMAIGWLTREGQVVIIEESGIMYFSTYYEMFY